MTRRFSISELRQKCEDIRAFSILHIHVAFSIPIPDHAEARIYGDLYAAP